jgi:hypothetical protein
VGSSLPQLALDDTKIGRMTLRVLTALKLTERTHYAWASGAPDRRLHLAVCL